MPSIDRPLSGDALLFDLEYHLKPGEILSLDGGVPHHVTSEDGGAFLLTVVHREGA